MKIKFTKPYPDPYNPVRVYLPGWVAEFTDADAERAIAAGFAQPAPPGAYSRKGESFECAAPSGPPEKQLAGEFTPTGEEIELNDLPETAKKQARRIEGGFFKKK